MALVQAVRDNDVAAIQQATSEELRATDENTMTALMWAANMGLTSMIRTLIESKADVGQCDAMGYTALFYTAFEENVPMQNRIDCAKVLLELGANPHHVAKTKLTASTAAKSRGIPQVASVIDASTGAAEGSTVRPTRLKMPSTAPMRDPLTKLRPPSEYQISICARTSSERTRHDEGKKRRASKEQILASRSNDKHGDSTSKSNSSTPDTTQSSVSTCDTSTDASLSPPSKPLTFSAEQGERVVLPDGKVYIAFPTEPVAHTTEGFGRRFSASTPTSIADDIQFLPAAGMRSARVMGSPQRRREKSVESFASKQESPFSAPQSTVQLLAGGEISSSLMKLSVGEWSEALNGMDPTMDMTALMIKCDEFVDDLSCVEHLLLARADPMKRANGDLTALHYATGALNKDAKYFNDRPALMALLMEFGAKEDVICKTTNQNPMEMAFNFFSCAASQGNARRAFPLVQTAHLLSVDALQSDIKVKVTGPFVAPADHPAAQKLLDALRAWDHNLHRYGWCDKYACETLLLHEEPLYHAYIEQYATSAPILQKTVEAKRLVFVEGYEWVFSKLILGKEAEDLDQAVKLAHQLPCSNVNLDHMEARNPEEIVELVVSAHRLQPRVTAFMRYIASECNAEIPAKSPRAKGLFRTYEKHLLSDVTLKFLDLARGCVNCPSMKSVVKALQVLESLHNSNVISIVRRKVRLVEPTSGGWRDILLNFTFKDDPFVAEIQIAHHQLFEIRTEMGAHRDYGEFRCAMEILEKLGEPLASPKAVQSERKSCSQNELDEKDRVIAEQVELINELKKIIAEQRIQLEQKSTSKVKASAWAAIRHTKRMFSSTNLIAPSTPVLKFQQ